MPALNRADEATRILAEYDGKLPAIMAMLERQFGVLHNRSQVLLTLCGIVISTTGFSGRIIAGTNRAAQVFVVAGVGLILLAAAVVCFGVLHLRWLTLQPGDSTAAWLDASLRYRDVKTNAYRIGVIVMLVGLTCYCASIAIMLLNPHEGGLPPR